MSVKSGNFFNLFFCTIWTESVSVSTLALFISLLRNKFEIYTQQSNLANHNCKCDPGDSVVGAQDWPAGWLDVEM